MATIRRIVTKTALTDLHLTVRAGGAVEQALADYRDRHMGVIE